MRGAAAADNQNMPRFDALGHGPPPDYKVLLVEGDAGAAATVRECLPPRAAMTHRRTLAAALRVATQRRFDVALLDGMLPDARESAAVPTLTAGARCPVILLTGPRGHHAGVRAVRAGAQDYLAKATLRPPQLQRAITSAIARHEALVQYQRVLDHSPDGILIVDGDGGVVFANPAALAAFGAGLIGSPMGIPIVGADTTEIILMDGRTAEMRVAPVPWRGAAAHLVLLRDVTERVRAVTELQHMTAELEELVVIDPLTRVLNRRGTEAALADVTAVGRRSGENGAIVLIDCDDFKTINDTCGYAAGDAVLCRVARAIIDSVRPGRDRVGRVGGDEFVVLLPGIRLDDAHLVAERIRAVIHNAVPPLGPARGVPAITASFGVAPIVPTAASLAEVIALAQAPLQQGKRHGKNTVRSEGRRSDARLLDIDEVLRQPAHLGVAAHAIVRPLDGTMTGVELLIRGPHGEPLESPDAIFMAAKRRHALAAVDLACARRCMSACGLLSGCSRVNVNLYVSTLLDTALEELLHILRAPAAVQLVVELNEQEFIRDPALVSARLDELRRQGVLIALDDVGYGRSSFEAIAALDPEFVKIDRNAVSGIAVSAEKRRVLQRMLSCLHGMSAAIVAEGVENDADAHVVADMGIPFAQGFLWGRPQLIALPLRHGPSEDDPPKDDPPPD